MFKKFILYKVNKFYFIVPVSQDNSLWAFFERFLSSFENSRIVIKVQEF